MDRRVRRREGERGGGRQGGKETEKQRDKEETKYKFVLHEGLQQPSKKDNAKEIGWAEREVVTEKESERNREKGIGE
jgi:hypothetical protein